MTSLTWPEPGGRHAQRAGPSRAAWLGLRGHEALGNRPEALSAFHRLKAQLGEDLGVSPSADTGALFIRILRGEGKEPGG